MRLSSPNWMILGATFRIPGGSQEGFLVTNKFGELYHIKELGKLVFLFVAVNYALCFD